ncbi:uncharacterized protein B0H18DRAFT_496254 [Fomitopsis serialis]|uniref:uncharacterized protein n=1 Tax=Fomitopsis serialis TaxID=139415 RepID=UPI002008719A|nr:uncharacterized protein B0H18DRAFT_496254 [Neoantrodia serialis]KAH9935030.1 hypothetical protein B0H18DRAFT_496254 [Neoantrodia serialis]
MSGEEYEVEAIHRATVLIGKQRRKTWSYYVKWKNYGPADNTWEPPDSFRGGSEHFIQNFWTRANTDGRDWQDLSMFKAGEEFFPQGPPRGVKARPKKAQETTEAYSDQPLDR